MTPSNREEKPPNGDKPSEYEGLRSLRNLGKKLGTELCLTLSQRSYCTGYHIRHVLQSDQNPVALVASDDQLAEKIYSLNARHGLHTVNHVVDALHPFSGNLGTPSSKKGWAILVRIAFDLRGEGEYDRFRAVRKEPNDLKRLKQTFRGWECRTAAMQAEPVAEKLNLGELKADTGGELPGSLFVQFGNRDRKTKAFYDAYFPGVHRLCIEVGLNPSFVACKALLAAVFQLGTYAESFGSETLVVILRGADPLGFGSGSTIIGHQIVQGNELATILETLAAHHQSLQSGAKMGATPENDLCGYSNFLGYEHLSFSSGGRRTVGCPEEIIRTVLTAANPAGQAVANLAFRRKNNLTTSVASFVEMAGLFCEERYEGVQLQFGLILGNPFLMKYWPGGMPVPVCGKMHPEGGEEAHYFYPLEDLPRQIHLIENPAERCLVIPFQREAALNKRVAAFVVEFEDFREAFASGPWGSQSDELAPYVYFTKLYPWTVGAVIGPHSEMRVFAGGELRAFRDGKGWRVIRDPVEVINERLPRYFHGEGGREREELVRSLSLVARQISPWRRPRSRGGLLVFAPWPPGDRRWNYKWVKKIFAPLHFADPERLEEIPHPMGKPGLDANLGPDHGKAPRRPWIRNLELRSPDKDRDDEAVLSLLTRAATVDGAVVLHGPNLAARSFGSRLDVPDPEEPDSGGTGHRTAVGFVERLGKKRHSAIAVKVSADGPISLTVWDGRKPVTFQLFQEVPVMESQEPSPTESKEG